MVSSHGESSRRQEGLMMFIAFQYGYEALAGLVLHTVIKIIPRTPKNARADLLGITDITWGVGNQPMRKRGRR